MLVANNGYELESLQGAELGERQRLDSGLLHAYVVEAGSRRALLALLAQAAPSGGRRVPRASVECRREAPFGCRRFRPRVHAAIDGEPVLLDPPLDFEIQAARPAVAGQVTTKRSPLDV